mmetsp:Transcript_24612/g.49082  ORF Transcript_24612/g.49082 Transcript_24612/m.49082 type:complete len:118 (+) Transcript_24612:373-726(+)
MPPPRRESRLERTSSCAEEHPYALYVLDYMNIRSVQAVVFYCDDQVLSRPCHKHNNLLHHVCTTKSWESANGQKVQRTEKKCAANGDTIIVIVTFAPSSLSSSRSRLFARKEKSYKK